MYSGRYARSRPYASMLMIDFDRLLQSDLKSLEEWQNKWKMSFNPSKCTVMEISLKRESHHTEIITSLAKSSNIAVLILTLESSLTVNLLGMSKFPTASTK